MEDNINNVNEGAIKTAARFAAGLHPAGRILQVKDVVDAGVGQHRAKKAAEKKNKELNKNMNGEAKTKFDEAYERTMSRFITPVAEGEHKEKGFLGKLGSAAKTAAGLGAAALAGGAIASPEFRSKLVGGAKGLFKGAKVGYTDPVGGVKTAQNVAAAGKAGEQLGMQKMVDMQPGPDAPTGTRLGLGDAGPVSRTPTMQKRVTNYGKPMGN
jgi:hypothetical protein